MSSCLCARVDCRMICWVCVWLLIRFVCVRMSIASRALFIFIKSSSNSHTHTHPLKHCAQFDSVSLSLSLSLNVYRLTAAVHARIVRAAPMMGSGRRRRRGRVERLLDCGRLRRVQRPVPNERTLQPAFSALGFFSVRSLDRVFLLLGGLMGYCRWWVVVGWLVVVGACVAWRCKYII